MSPGTVISYSGKFSREKTFMKFATWEPLVKVFSMKSGHVHTHAPICDWEFYESFLCETLTSYWSAKVFSFECFQPEEVGHDFRRMCIYCHASYAMCCFCWLSGLTWVVWAYTTAYGKRTLIRIHDHGNLLWFPAIRYLPHLLTLPTYKYYTCN